MNPQSARIGDPEVLLGADGTPLWCSSCGDGRAGDRFWKLLGVHAAQVLESALLVGGHAELLLHLLQPVLGVVDDLAPGLHPDP